MKVNQVKCWFLRRGETGIPGENISVQRGESTHSTHIWRWSDLGIKSGPHWWEASALTIAPSLHPHNEWRRKVSLALKASGWMGKLCYFHYRHDFSNSEKEICCDNTFSICSNWNKCLNSVEKVLKRKSLDLWVNKIWTKLMNWTELYTF